MAVSGSTGLSEAGTPHGSQTNDDEIIKEQLQADINSQTKSHPTDLSEKARKRKSRDAYEGSASDVNESRKKKRKEKDRAKQTENHLLKRVQENRFNESSSNEADPTQKLTNGTQEKGKPLPRSAEPSSRALSESHSTEINKGGKKKEGKDKIRRDSDLIAIAGRTSLGSNREALLQSILKGCSPDKFTNMKPERILPSESEIGDASATPYASISMKTSSKRRSRPRVSMVPILPEGYKPGLPGSKGRFHCPVEGCDRQYTRKTTLGEHMNTLHAGQYFNNNMDGTMSIISPKDYQIAISSDNGQTVIEIPKTPLPIKATKTAHHAANGEKKRTVSPTKAIREDSIDTDATNKTEHGGPTASQLQSGSSKSLPAAKPTTSKLKLPERDSSEYETSSEDESSEANDRLRTSRDSTVRSPMVEKSRPKSSVDSTFKAPTITSPMSSKSKGAGSSSFNKIDHETSDEMEDWEIEPGVVVGSGSDNDGDSETEHNRAYSSVYITSAGAGVKFSGVHFQIIRVAPGSTAPGPDVPYLRVCSVAAGKVRVRVGSKNFSIGAHGMWRIRAGERCTVTNRHYSEAVIHVSTIKTD